MRPNRIRLMSRVLVVGITLALCLCGVGAKSAAASGRIVVWPSGGFAVPVGRFGRTDLEANPPKLGHVRGTSIAVDIGYSVSSQMLIGVSVNRARFDLDFGDPSHNVFNAVGNTTILSAEVWLRHFVFGGLKGGGPFLSLALGTGGPEGKVEFGIPPTFNVNDTIIDGRQLVSEVSKRISLAAGGGIILPINKCLSLTAEMRYRLVSTKGANRVDIITTVDGDEFRFTHGSDQSGAITRLKANSDTNSWETRWGLVFFLR